jgi:hypothetical protein
VLIGIGLGGAAVGYAQARGLFDRLPAIAGSRMVTLGAVGFALNRYVKNPHVKLAGLAALAIAASDFGRRQGGAVSGDDLGDDLDGDEI